MRSNPRSGGARGDEVKQIKLLNRTISWTEEGIQWEADARHAQIVVEQLGLKHAKGGEHPSAAGAAVVGREHREGNQQ